MIYNYRFIDHTESPIAIDRFGIGPCRSQVHVFVTSRHNLFCERDNKEPRDRISVRIEGKRNDENAFVPVAAFSNAVRGLKKNRPVSLEDDSRTSVRPLATPTRIRCSPCVRYTWPIKTSSEQPKNGRREVSFFESVHAVLLEKENGVPDGRLEQRPKFVQRERFVLSFRRNHRSLCSIYQSTRGIPSPACRT